MPQSASTPCLSHPSFLHQEILVAPSSKYIRNLAISLSLYLYHPGLGHHHHWSLAGLLLSVPGGQRQTMPSLCSALQWFPKCPTQSIVHSLLLLRAPHGQLPHRLLISAQMSLFLVKYNLTTF